MKAAFVLLFALSLILTPSTALFHNVRVYLKTSSGDIGSTVEVRTSVRFNLPGGGSITRSSFTTGLPESTEFPGFGELLFDEDYSQTPVSVLLTVTEDDGSGTTDDDGVCRLLIQPPSFPIGEDRFECLRQSANGLVQEWRVIMLIDTSLGLGIPLSSD